MQTTRRSRVDITGCRNHNIGAGYRFFVTAAVERFTQMDLTVFGENRPITVAEQSAAGHINIIKGAVTGQNTTTRHIKLKQIACRAANGDMLAVCAEGRNIAFCRSIDIRFQYDHSFTRLRYRGAEFSCSRYFIAWRGDSRLLRIPL